MSRTEPQFRTLVAMLQAHFRKERYSLSVTTNYPVAARRFLRVLERRDQTFESVSCEDVETYLDGLRLRRRQGPIPDHSRRTHGAATRFSGEMPCEAASFALCRPSHKKKRWH
jgi:hypothetical protein